jgi:hypothetical protein
VNPPTPERIVADWAALDRRGLLRAAGVLVAAGVLPTGCGGIPRGLAPPPDPPLAVLSPRGYATFQAFAMRLAGPRVAAAIAAGSLDPAAAADAWSVRLPAVGAALGQGLALLEWGVWPVLPKWATFTALAPTAQDRVIEDLQRSRWAWKRDLYKGLKSLATLAVFTAPAARPLVGFPGPFDAEGIAAAMADLEEEPPSPRRARCGPCGAGSTSCRSGSARACGCRCASTAARPWSPRWTTRSSCRPPTSQRCPASSTPAW